MKIHDSIVRFGHTPVVARLKMNDGFQIAAVPDSDQIGKFRHTADLGVL